jgi:trehalose utilization protein
MTRLTFPICPFLLGMHWGTAPYELLRAIMPNVVVDSKWPEAAETGRILVLVDTECVIRGVQVEVHLEVSEALKQRIVAEPPYTIEHLVADFPGINPQVSKAARDWRVVAGGALAVEPTLDAALRDVKQQLTEMRPKKPAAKPLTTEKPKRVGAAGD